MAQLKPLESKSFKFVPAMVGVKLGARIVWTNLDKVAHTIMSDNGAFPVSSSLNTGGTYSVVLSAPGNYHYHCGIHSFMQGTIRVLVARSRVSDVAQP